MIKELRLVQMGDALGLMIPAPLAAKYGLRDEVVLEERKEGLLIHAPETPKLSWEATYRQMEAEQEDWSDWHAFLDEDEI